MQNTKLGVRILLVLLAVLLVIPMVLTSCQSGGDKETEETTAKKKQEGEDDTDVHGNARVDSGHDGFNYGGKTFTIFVSGDWDTENIWVDEEEYDKSDDIQAAVVTRNRRLSEQYGIEIRQVEATEDEGIVSFVTNSINASDGVFDAISTTAEQQVELALDGYLVDLASIDTINLEGAWWDQTMIGQCTLDGHLFWLVGDYTTTDNNAVHCFAFNKNMFAQNESKLGSKSPYEYVNDGTWTLDTMFTMASSVGADKDGNGTYNEDDIYGLCYPQTASQAFLNCCGVKLGSVHDDEPYITLDFWSEKTADIWEKCIDMCNANWSFNWHRENNTTINMEDMFKNNQILFYGNYMAGMVSLRSAADGFEFGILPYPKYDEAQEEYISPFHSYGTPFISIPVSSSNVSDAGAVIDLLSYESMYTLTPAYYTVTLEGKMSRDEESLDMLDLIFSTKSYDFGFISCWGGWTSEGPLKQLWCNKSYNLSSTYASNQKKLQKAINKQLESYENYEAQNG